MYSNGRELGTREEVCGEPIPEPTCLDSVEWAFNFGQFDERNWLWYPSLPVISQAPWGNANKEEVRHALFCDGVRDAGCANLTRACTIHNEPAVCPSKSHFYTINESSSGQKKTPREV